ILKGIAVAGLLASCLAASCRNAAPLGAPPSAPAGTTEMRRVFFDDFKRGDSLWEPAIGQWSIGEAGGLSTYSSKPREYALAMAGAANWADYRVDATVTIHDDRSGQVGVAARVQSEHYYYELLLGRDEKGVKTWLIRAQRRHTWTTIPSG